jgi:cyclopropane fatty-acyl-phospholipid synthase-like methyltransferase
VPAAGLDETRVFYDEFFDHLLHDRLRLNPRHSVVAGLLRAHVREGSTLLDLGCGIGITSELAARRARKVVGVDLSPTLIEYARATVKGVEFHTGDIASIDLGERFDTIALFDVYEHLPAGRRAELWRAIDRQLANPGLVLMTVPHPAATEQTMAVQTEDLQIVDEVVWPNDLLEDARVVGLLPKAFATYAIDRDPEYYWVVLERSAPPVAHPRSRWADPLTQLRVRARARRYWRAASTLRNS